MIRKSILNGLTLSLLLTLIPMPAHAGWLSSISNYFNQPSKNSLVATTALAGVSLFATFVCAWNWWKKSKAAEIVRTENQTLKQSLKDRTATSVQLMGEAAQKQVALEKAQIELRGQDKLIDQLAASYKSSQDQASQLTTEVSQAQAHIKKQNEELAAHKKTQEELQHSLAARKDQFLKSCADYDNRGQLITALEMENETLKKRLAKFQRHGNLSDSVSF